jgi:hypothetical protein
MSEKTNQINGCEYNYIRYDLKNKREIISNKSPSSLNNNLQQNSNILPNNSFK